MLGPPKARCLDRPVLVSLEGLVPANHFYRHLDDALDLCFVRDWVAGRYAARGRPSIDPVVFFKLQLIMFFEGIRSERRLVATAALNLAHRWYLGYHLDEPLPDHSSLSKIRDRYGLAVFRRFFDRVVQLCADAGLVWGEELFFDATKVRANAAMGSVVPRLREVVDGHLVELFTPGEAAASRDSAAVGEAAATGPGDPTSAEAPSPLRPGEVAAPAAGKPQPATGEVMPPARWDLLEQCRPRGLSGPCARLPRHRRLPASHAQAPSLARAALRRGQAVARAAPVPSARPPEGEYGGAADRSRAEPETLAGGDRLGATQRTDWEFHGVPADRHATRMWHLTA